MQAHINAVMRSDEFIMESLVTFDKVKLLIFDLLVTEVWKQKVLPILKPDIINISSFRSYMTVLIFIRSTTRPVSATSCRSFFFPEPPSTRPTTASWNSPTTATENCWPCSRGRKRKLSRPRPKS